MTKESKVNTRKLESKIKYKKYNLIWTYYLGFYSIIILSIVDVTITTAINRTEDKDDKPNIPFEKFKFLWSLLLVISLVKFCLHLFSIYLIWSSTRIMRRIAVDRGNLESIKDIRYITIVGVLCFMAFTIQIGGYLSVTILSATGLMDHDAVTAEALYLAATGIVLFTAYAILINIFWTYVININKDLEKRACHKRSSSDVKHE